MVRSTPSVIVAGLSLLMVAACASKPKPEKENKESLLDRAPDKVELQIEEDELKRAAQAPLYDLNLKRDEIPPQLANLKNIYSPPPNPGCQNMRIEVAALTEVLGPDEIITGGDGKNIWRLNPSGTLESTMSSIIPFNDIIRTLSGAKGHESKLAKAYFKGQVRRSFLRGWAADKNCYAPIPEVKPKKKRKRRW